jgi:hypothetical protein
MTAVRLILVVGLIRVTVRGEIGSIRFNTVDRALAIYALSILIISSLRIGTTQGLVFRIGIFGDVVATYLVVSALLRDRQDLFSVLRKVGWSSFHLRF